MKVWLLAAAIIGGAILLSTAAMIYFSPFQTCVRSAESSLEYDNQVLEEQVATRVCATGN